MASGKFNNALLSSDEEEEILAGFSSLGSGLWTSGRKNVLHKLLHIPYRRLKAGFSVCWLCLFVKYTRCERLLLVEVCKAFSFVFLLLLLLFFRHLKITLDSEQPMLKEERIIPSVWGGINVLNIFKEASIFLIIVHSSCELILWPVLGLPSPGWIKTHLYSVISSYGYFFYMPRFFNLPSRYRTSFIPVFNSVKEPYC